jgi:uncharacterized membrane protein (UPF0136 family)
MTGIPPVQLIAAGITALYGLISLGGGILGYQLKGSTASLVAGGIAGLLLLACAAGVFRQPVWSLVGAIIVALALLGRFAMVTFQHKGELGSFLNEGSGITAYVMIVGGGLVVLAAGLALLAEAAPPASS